MVAYLGEKIMIKVVEYIGIILWIIYLFLLINRELCRKNKYIDEYNKKLIVKHPFHLFRIDSIFFLVVYLIYNNFADVNVISYIYIGIIITNIVYVIYDISDNYKVEKNVLKKEFINYFMGFLFVIFLLWFMIFSKNVVNVYLITLIINILIPICIWGLKLLLKKE